MLLFGQVLMSCEWPNMPDGQYYWLHTHWIDNSDFSSDSQMALAVIGDMKLLYTTQVRLWSQRWKLPGTNTVVFQQIFSFPQFGQQAAQPNFNLLLASRWRMRGADGSFTYHLHRQPIGAAYITGGEWSTLGLAQQVIRKNTFIAQGIYRTQTGSLITSGEVASKVAMWQLRHGTKRRERRFWLP